MDRRKDMIISGGFNIYPSDLESVLGKHEAIKEAAVVGVASRQWGETPVAFVVLKPGSSATADEIRAWANERLGKTQRLASVEIRELLPRSAIGKVLKRELREGYKVTESS
jgi:acyl-CoA synthetase (AMP-forming)/AMP-acid ligase II